MKFKLVEGYDYYTEEARLLVQEYAYDAIDELKNSSFDVYFKWFLKETEYNSDPAILKQAVKDFYIEAVDSGKIKQTKTMMTSALTKYIQENKNLLNDVYELVKNCPEHLQHELKLVIDAAELTESLNEDLPSPFKKLLYEFIKEHHDLLNNDVDELYLLCPVGLKRDLVELLNSANIKINKELINKFEFLVTEYNPQDLDRIVIDHNGKAGTTTDNVYYIITNWDKFDFLAYEALNEDLLTESKLYRLDFDYLSTDSSEVNSDYIYLYGKNKETMNELASRIYKQDSHESYAKHWQQFFNNVSGLTFRSSKIVPVATVLSDTEHLFTLTYSPWRSSSRKAAAQDSDLQAFINKEHASNNTNKTFLHHPDGTELIEDPKQNSYILYNESNDGRFYPLVIHNMLHSSAVDPRKLHDSGVLSTPIVVYDTSLKAYVCRHLKIEVV